MVVLEIKVFGKIGECEIEWVRVEESEKEGES